MIERDQQLFVTNTPYNLGNYGVFPWIIFHGEYLIYSKNLHAFFLCTDVYKFFVGYI